MHVTFRLPAVAEHSSKAQHLLCQVAWPRLALLLGDHAEQPRAGRQHGGRYRGGCQVSSDGELLCSPILPGWGGRNC